MDAAQVTFLSLLTRQLDSALTVGATTFVSSDVNILYKHFRPTRRHHEAVRRWFAKILLQKLARHILQWDPRHIYGLQA
jgi:hypothetical protein